MKNEFLILEGEYGKWISFWFEIPSDGGARQLP
jgi:hypothetical protein